MNSSPPNSDRQHQIHVLLDEYLQQYAPHSELLSSHFSDSFTLQNISHDVVLATALLATPELEKDDTPQSNAGAGLALIFRLESGIWKIVHHSFLHPSPHMPPAQTDALQQLKAQNQALQTQLQENLATLRQKEKLYRQLVEDTRDVLWQTDAALHLTYISPADERLRGFTAQEMLGRHVFEMFTDEGIAIVQKRIQARAVAESNGLPLVFSLFEVQHRCKDGQLLWGEVLAKTDHNAEGALIGYHGITREITERKLLQDQVRDLAFYDPLTQLANRRLLVEHLSQALLSIQRKQGHGALLFLDLDNFKSLNDAHGHCAGDLLLIEVARRLKACVRNIDTVARFGGDEFVVLLGTLSGERSQAVTQAGVIAEKIRACLAQPYRIALTTATQPNTPVEHHGTASIGVMVFSQHDKAPHDILDRADTAMYQAKEGGRNRVCFDTNDSTQTRAKNSNQTLSVTP